jgi:hypothetical protein
MGVASSTDRATSRHDPASQFADVKDLLVTYAKQETVDPIKGLGRFVGYGVGAMLLIGIGAIELTIALLRLLQTETGSPLTGNWSWVPYLITLLVASGVAYVSIKAISRTSKKGQI